MKKFAYETVLEPVNICNLITDREKLLNVVKHGDRAVFYGRRNTGKTSLVKSIIMPAFNSDKKSLAIFVDLMGVKSIENIATRFKYGMEQSLSKIGPTQKLIMDIGKIIKGARPTISLDPITGIPTISLGLESNDKKSNIHDIFSLMSDYQRKNNVLLIIDEFQDISYVNEAEGILRDALQNLPPDLPVIILGSKKHLLSNLFANPAAPFAGWGKYIEISSISTEDYLEYILERFNYFKLNISYDVVKFTQDLLDNIPEPINIICEQVLRDLSCEKSVEVKESDIKNALRKTIDNRSGLFEERFLRFSQKERRFLEVLAVSAPVLEPTGKDFLKKVNLSSGGGGPLIKRLESDAIIYKTKMGYVVSDPLMAHYLKIKQ